MENNLQYAEKSYWNGRFANEEEFEWLTDFEQFKNIILPLLKFDSRILHVGCGNSQLSQNLYQLGYTNITNLDYSEILVEKGREKYPEMTWICDDIREMNKVSSSSFDVVLEKATIEALLVAEKSQWEPSDKALETLDQVFHAIHKVLVPDGCYISISLTQPHFRLPALLRHPLWSSSVREFGDHFHFYVFQSRRRSPDSNEAGPLTEDENRFSTIAPSWSRKGRSELKSASSQ